jgi:hypothetical protein
MAHRKLSYGAILVAAGVMGACSSNSGNPGSSGTAGTGGSAGTVGTAGASGTAGAGGMAGHGGSGGSMGAAGNGSGGASGAPALVTPTEVVSVTGCGSIRLVINGGKIYYTNKTAGTVNSVPVSGGTPTPIAMTQNKPNPIAVDGTNVYWGNDGDKTVMKQALAPGSTAMTFVPASTEADTMNVNFVNALLVDGTTLYIGRGYDSYKIATSGGTMTHLSRSPAADLGLPGAFVTDGMHLYQPEISHNAITRETLDGLQNGLLEDGMTRMALAPDRLAVSRAGLVTDAIALSGQYVIWANLNGIESHDKDKTQFEGATLNVIANSAEFTSISGFVISGSKIYLGESDSSEVEVVDLQLTAAAGNAPVASVIVKNQANPAEFAADDSSIYYTTITKTDATGVCKILKIAK